MRQPIRSNLGCASVMAMAVAFLVLALATTRADATPVSGTQSIVDESAGKFRMSGGLLGKWRITSFHELATHPVYRAKGTERFRGCLNRDHDHSCHGDPKGTLKFRFHYWARLASDGSTELGTCAHPVAGGTGDFANASGFLMMVDTPVSRAPYVKTHYQGVIYVNRHADKLAARRPC
jgi:hypothetical protein